MFFHFTIIRASIALCFPSESFYFLFFYFPTSCACSLFWRNKEQDGEKGQREKTVRVKLGAPKSFLVIVL